uniref:TraB domain-containing protein n=1 Tax=Paramoeba aestuarina TaxID=180227 RepID=A0A7S4P1C6_9EUKA
MALGLTLARSTFLLSSPSLLPSSLFLCPSLSLSRFSSDVKESQGVTHMTPSISILRGGKGQEIYLVGTHASDESGDVVEEVITTVKPDNVFLELCPKRARELRDGSNMGQYDAFQSVSYIEGMIKNMGYNVPDSALQLSKAYFQSIGLIPGDAFKRAIEIVHQMREESGSSRPELIYGDIDGEKTILKIGESVSLSSMFQMINAAKRGGDYPEFRNDPVCQELARKLQDPHTSVEDKVEVLKNRQYLKVFSKVAHTIFPPGANALLTDRAAYMCDGLLELKNETTVAVVGMAHMDGIEEQWQKKSSH